MGVLINITKIYEDNEIVKVKFTSDVGIGTWGRWIFSSTVLGQLGKFVLSGKPIPEF